MSGKVKKLKQKLHVCLELKSYLHFNKIQSKFLKKINVNLCSINFCGFYFFKHTLRLYDKNCQSSIYSKTKKNSKSVVYSNTISFAKIDHFWHGKI